MASAKITEAAWDLVVEYLVAEIRMLDQARWLIKDRATVQEAYDQLTIAMQKRIERLQKTEPERARQALELIEWKDAGPGRGSPPR